MRTRFGLPSTGNELSNLDVRALAIVNGDKTEDDYDNFELDPFDERKVQRFNQGEDVSVIIDQYDESERALVEEKVAKIAEKRGYSDEVITEEYPSGDLYTYASQESNGMSVEEAEDALESAGVL